MAQSELLQAQYTRAVVRDVPRHMLPRDGAWLLRDWIPNLSGAALRGRGGWAYASPALTGAARVDQLAYAPFPGGGQLVAIDDRGHVFKVDSVSSATDKGAANVPLQTPIFFKDQLILPGATTYKYDGSAAPSALAGAPAADYGVAYKSRLFLGKDRKLYASGVLDATSWDTTNGWIALTESLRGIAAMRNAMIVWGADGCERIRGDVPPPGGDMVREPLFEEGCVDARSIVVFGDRAIWANADGIFITDGAGIDNLVKLSGIETYWRERLAGYTTAWRIAAGTFGPYYVLTITDGSGFVDGLALDPRSKATLFLGNLPACAFASRHNDVPETFFALRTAGRVGGLSTILTPGPSYQADANGSNVQPVIETADYRGKPGSRRWRNLRVGVDLDAPAGTYIETSYVTSPEDDTYTLVTEDDGTTPIKINPTSGFERVKVPLGVAADGLGFKLRLVGPANDVQLFDLEADLHEREASR